MEKEQTIVEKKYVIIILKTKWRKKKNLIKRTRK